MYTDMLRTESRHMATVFLVTALTFVPPAKGLKVKKFSYFKKLQKILQRNIYMHHT